jgi:hypothetical protein
MLIRSTGDSGCPACGATHTACGQSGPVNPVDLPSAKERTVGPVRKYKVNKNGYDTILKLNDADAKLYPGAVLVEPEPVAASPAAPVDEHEPDDSPEQTNEPADGPEQSAEPDETPDETPAKARTASNKARRPAGNKTEK